MQALVLDPTTRTVTLRTVPTPVPAAGEVLVRVHAIALNPVDGLYVQQPIAESERVIGTDFSDVVAAVGEGVERVVGERVAGFVQGACSTNLRPGAAATYTLSPSSLLWRVPQSISFASAAAVNLCGLTAAQGLFYRLGLPLPPGFPTPSLPNPTQLPPIEVSKPFILIYAGSTSVGMYAIQLARRAAPHAAVLAVASGKHAPLLESYGAEVLDRASDWVAAVQARGGAHYALDCISEGATVEKVHAALAPDARLGVFRSPRGGGYSANLRVEPVYGAVWEGLGVEIGYNGATIAASPPAKGFAEAFYKYLDAQPLAPNPTRVVPGGLGRVVLDGLPLLGGPMVAERAAGVKAISGEKIVFELE